MTSDAVKARRYDHIVTILQYEDGDDIELQSCADAIQEISLIVAGTYDDREPAWQEREDEDSESGTMTDGKELYEVTFTNVTITVANMADAKAAYARLCDVLATANDLEYETDGYVLHPRNANEPTVEGSTQELWPDVYGEKETEA